VEGKLVGWMGGWMWDRVFKEVMGWIKSEEAGSFWEIVWGFGLPWENV
jgi:hypothetical protein